MLGLEGVGKSFIMSNLVKQGSSIFPQQTSAHFVEQRHETNGIDMHVLDSEEQAFQGGSSSLGVLLLDVQPLFSNSLICEWIQKDAKLDSDVMGYENYMDLLR